MQGFPHSTAINTKVPYDPGSRYEARRLSRYPWTVIALLNKPLPSADIWNMVRILWAGMPCRTRRFFIGRHELLSEHCEDLWITYILVGINLGV